MRPSVSALDSLAQVNGVPQWPQNGRSAFGEETYEAGVARPVHRRLFRSTLTQATAWDAALRRQLRQWQNVASNGCAVVS